MAVGDSTSKRPTVRFEPAATAKTSHSPPQHRQRGTSSEPAPADRLLSSAWICPLTVRFDRVFPSAGRRRRSCPTQRRFPDPRLATCGSIAQVHAACGSSACPSKNGRSPNSSHSSSITSAKNRGSLASKSSCTTSPGDPRTRQMSVGAALVITCVGRPRCGFFRRVGAWSPASTTCGRRRAFGAKTPQYLRLQLLGRVLVRTID